VQSLVYVVEGVQMINTDCVEVRIGAKTQVNRATNEISSYQHLNMWLQVEVRMNVEAWAHIRSNVQIRVWRQVRDESKVRAWYD
jgi:hypothetical protein